MAKNNEKWQQIKQCKAAWHGNQKHGIEIIINNGIISGVMRNESKIIWRKASMAKAYQRKIISGVHQ